MQGLSSLCKDASPDKSILISPFFKGKNLTSNYFTPQRTMDEWSDIFDKAGENIDFCAFQDGSAPLEELGEYFSCMKKICKEYEIQLWGNVETFERDVRSMFYPIPFDILREKIEIEKPIVDKMITFEFSHFLSPQSIYPSAQNLNKLYKDYFGRKK